MFNPRDNPSKLIFFMFTQLYNPTARQLEDAEKYYKNSGSFDAAIWEAFTKADARNKAKLAYMYPSLRPFDWNVEETVYRDYDTDTIVRELFSGYGKQITVYILRSRLDDLIASFESINETSANFDEWIKRAIAILNADNAYIESIK